MQGHWDNVYRNKPASQVSWFRPHLETSVALIERATQGRRSAAILDAGGGASTLVDDLLDLGYSSMTVLDISRAALDVAQQRLGDQAKRVQWLCLDVTRTELAAAAYDVWHDRAVFHFLTSAEDRAVYVRNVERAVKPAGHIVVATFGPEGPVKCSGLDVMRYDAESLQREFGPNFRWIDSKTVMHQTPSGATQQFVFCYGALAERS